MDRLKQLEIQSKENPLTHSCHSPLRYSSFLISSIVATFDNDTHVSSTSSQPIKQKKPNKKGINHYSISPPCRFSSSTIPRRIETDSIDKRNINWRMQTAQDWSRKFKKSRPCVLCTSISFMNFGALASKRLLQEKRT